MSTHYSVIRFVPDPIRGEYMNVGVLAADESGAKCHFINSWRTIDAFGSEKVPYLKEFARELQSLCQENGGLLIPSSEPMNAEVLAKLVTSWTSFIQFSDVRFSMLSIEGALEELAPIFLREAPPAKSRPRDKRAAVRIAREALQTALLNWNAQDQFSLSTEQVITGKVADHQFDLTLVNHAPRICLSGLSLELKTADQIRGDIDRISYKMLDTRIENPGFGLAVVSVGEDQSTEHWNMLKRMCSNLEAELIGEDETSNWAESRVKGLMLA